jgi:hypothetical protein
VPTRQRKTFSIYIFLGTQSNNRKIMIFSKIFSIKDIFR